jgi:hypothetical protein
MDEIEKNLFVRRFIETAERLDFQGYEELKSRFALLSQDDRESAVLDILILMWRKEND